MNKLIIAVMLFSFNTKAHLDYGVGHNHRMFHKAVLEDNSSSLLEEENYETFEECLDYHIENLMASMTHRDFIECASEGDCLQVVYDFCLRIME